MNFDPSRANLLFVCLVLLAWGGGMAFIWFRQEQDSRKHRENDFALWKHRETKEQATFGEFLASEQAPRSYLSRIEKSIVLTLLVLFALYFEFFK